MKYKHAFAAATLALATLVAGCSNSSDTAGSASSQTSASNFNQTDVSFATDMIPHHRQAVEMAELAPTRARSPQVKELAAQIQAAQDPEVETMSGWLKQWGEKVPGDMAGHDMSSSMPGMMSTTDMDALAGLSGAAFDREFLTMMKAHHEGAIKMAKTEQDKGKYTQATALAGEIESAQTDEIATIDGLLAKS